MLKNDHLELAAFIKNVHESLRIQSQLLGEETAWKSHCSDEDTLKKYACAMKELSLNFWEINFQKGDKAVSRIKWTVETCISYFTKNIGHFRHKEETVINKFNLPIESVQLMSCSHKWLLLDVGSCYNPFSPFDYFEVTAVDIAPAIAEVYKCDFLNVNITNTEIKNSNVITSMKSNSFDIVVFSLFLEYLPSPKQRLECCQKAYKLLKPEGLLIIITPDSKHMGANAKLMKSWRFVLANIGFLRIKYEKLPHLHCMAFRKSINKEVTINWVKLYGKEQIYDGIYIPQDFTIKSSVMVNDKSKDVVNPDDIVDLFLVLPDGD